MNLSEFTDKERELLQTTGLVESPNWMNRFMLGATEFTRDDLEEITEQLNEVIETALSIQQKIRKAKIK